MELVINIEQSVAEAIALHKYIPKDYEDIVVNAFCNATPLPDGHGELKDADKLHSTFNKKCDEYNIDNLSFMSDMDMNFDLAQTLVPADKDTTNKVSNEEYEEDEAYQLGDIE